MYNKTFSIGDVLEQGWELFKKYWLMSLLILGTGIVTYIVSSFFMPFDQEELQELMAPYNRYADNNEMLVEVLDKMDRNVVVASELVTGLIKAIITFGLIRMTFFVIRGVRNELSFEAFNAPFLTYVKYIVVEFLVGIITGVGLILCIIPGILCAVRLQYATYCILDNQEVGIIEAIKMSWDMTRGNFWRLFGFAIIGLLICILGLLCCCIGIYVALAWLLFANSLIYFALKPDMIFQDEATTSYNKEESL